ncbi:MAG: class I SAM-dependent methyltransferase [Chloroflexota bacterium]|nr:class I SAM-dependent methyltransferase [Chloroflexota bacterium]
MDTIHSKHTRTLDAAGLHFLASQYDNVLLDLGAGDGRYTLHTARRRPDCLSIGLDACADGMRKTSRTAPPNALYVVANALVLPEALTNTASHVTINFPWGSLLTALLGANPALAAGLRAVTRPGATLEIRLNLGALLEIGCSPEAAPDHVRRTLWNGGFSDMRTCGLTVTELRAFPTTWAKRLAFGRDPRGLLLRASRAPELPLTTRTLGALSAASLSQRHGLYYSPEGST